MHIQALLVVNQGARPVRNESVQKWQVWVALALTRNRHSN